jgi:hypothetical protein
MSTGDAAAVFQEILFFERLEETRLSSSPVATVYRDRAIPVASGQSNSVGLRRHILAVESDHAKKGVIGLKNPAFELPNEDADDVGVNKAEDPSFPLQEDRLYLAAGRYVLGKLGVDVMKIAIGNLQIVRQRVKGCDHLLQFVLLLEGRTPQPQWHWRVGDP